MTNNAWDTPFSSTNGQLLIGQASGAPSWATLTQGSGSTITNGSGSITVAFDAASSDWVLISTATASASATISFTDLTSTYNTYILEIEGLAPATNNTDLQMRTSTNNGSSYDSGSSDYAYSYMSYSETSGGDDGGNSSSGRMIIAAGTLNEELGNNTNENLSATLYIFNPSATQYTQILINGNYHDDTTDLNGFQSVGARESTADVDAFQIFISSGNIATGNFRLYGANA